MRRRDLAVIVFTIAAVLSFCTVVVVREAQDRNGIKHAVQQIQDSRLRITRANCEDQNARNRNTVGELTTIFNAATKAAASPQQTLVLQQAQTSALLVINVLAPHQDCPALVARARTR